MPTGEVEIPLDELTVLSVAESLPFPIDDGHVVGESTRLYWRFVDLRRDALHRRIQQRAAVVTAMRQRLENQGFLEVSTPILTSSSPESARDFLVPSRIHPGHFFALPQASSVISRSRHASATRMPAPTVRPGNFTSWTSRWPTQPRRMSSNW